MTDLSGVQYNNIIDMVMTSYSRLCEECNCGGKSKSSSIFENSIGEFDDV